MVALLDEVGRNWGSPKPGEENQGFSVRHFRSQIPIGYPRGGTEWTVV